jgi:hypothetical protein
VGAKGKTFMDSVPEVSKNSQPNFTFDFLVTGITREEAEVILDLIHAKVGEFGGMMGGGFVGGSMEASDGEKDA